MTIRKAVRRTPLASPYLAILAVALVFAACERVNESRKRDAQAPAPGSPQGEGPPVFSGQPAEGIYLPEGGAVQSIGEAPKPKAAGTAEERVTFGERVFKANCLPCHQADGQGIPGAFPPLAGSDFLNADKQRAIGIPLNGLQGKITVNGKEFNGVMPAQLLNDEDLANVLTFVYHSWGNSKKVVTPGEVRAARKK